MNEAIREGMAADRGRPEPPFQTHDMGEALVDLTKALSLAGSLESEELARKVSQGK